jgi:hypothetical protein
VNDGTSIPIIPVFVSASGSKTDNSVPIISSNSQFIMDPGVTLEYQFFNTNPGTLKITIFYRIIGGQNNPDSLIYGSIKDTGFNTPTTLSILGIGTNVAFVKSLIILPLAADDFILSFTDDFKAVTCVQDITTTVISGNEYLFIPNPNDLTVSPSVVTTYSYYFSYYYDPLYKV